MSDYYELSGIVCEDSRVNEGILTFSYMRNVPMHKVSNYKDFFLIIDGFADIHLILLCGFSIIVKDDILSRKLVFNIHTGKLPEYKGRHPTFFATIAQEKHLYMTLHKVVSGIDTGKIVAARKCSYYFWMNETDIFEVLIDSVPFLIDKLHDFLEGKSTLQPNIGGKYYPPVKKENKVIAPGLEPNLILNIIRAQCKYEGALLSYSNNVYGIKEAVVSILSNNFEIENDYYVLNEGKLVGIKISPEYYIRFKKTERL